MRQRTVGQLARDIFDQLIRGDEPDPEPIDPVDLLLTTAFDCAVKHNLPSCTVSWKCRPAEMRCIREASECPCCGGKLVHYRQEHEEAGWCDGPF